MSDKLRVAQEATLLAFLNENLHGWSRKKIKQRLQTGCVVINGEQSTQYDFALVAGDNIEVLASPKSIKHGVAKLHIIYQDAELIVINKPAGLLSVASATETKQHALAILRVQLSSAKQEVKLWPVHRLDRDTSGVLMFATSREMREAIMARGGKTEKTYLAIVAGCPKESEGTIDQPLRLDSKDYRMHVGAHPEAKNAVTHYQTKRTVNNRSLVEVQIETGRQHQIRAHLAWLGHAVIGDARYGKNGPRMGLHAQRVSIIRPDTEEKLVFEAPAPSDFLLLLKKKTAAKK
ncbi:MAG: RluA family pseudouridine synthase [Psychrobium sp.]|nr:RluA family pseudouridine synthase [Psychrobium sp.]